LNSPSERGHSRFKVSRMENSVKEKVGHELERGLGRNHHRGLRASGTGSQSRGERRSSEKTKTEAVKK